MLVILNNPVQALLMRHPERWPGVSSWDAHMGNGTFTGRYVLKKELRAMRKATKNPDLTRKQAREHKAYTVELARLPAFADLDGLAAGCACSRSVRRSRSPRAGYGCAWHRDAHCNSNSRLSCARSPVTEHRHEVDKLDKGAENEAAVYPAHHRAPFERLGSHEKRPSAAKVGSLTTASLDQPTTAGSNRMFNCDFQPW